MKNKNDSFKTPLASFTFQTQYAPSCILIYFGQTIYFIDAACVFWFNWGFRFLIKGFVILNSLMRIRLLGNIIRDRKY